MIDDIAVRRVALDRLGLAFRLKYGRWPTGSDMSPWIYGSMYLIGRLKTRPLADVTGRSMGESQDSVGAWDYVRGLESKTESELVGFMLALVGGLIQPASVIGEVAEDFYRSWVNEALTGMTLEAGAGDLWVDSWGRVTGNRDREANVDYWQAFGILL